MLPIFSLGAPWATVLLRIEFSTQTHVAHTSFSPSVFMIPLLSLFFCYSCTRLLLLSLSLSLHLSIFLFLSLSLSAPSLPLPIPFSPAAYLCASLTILASRYSSVTPSVSFNSCISTGVWDWRVSRTVGTSCSATQSHFVTDSQKNTKIVWTLCLKISFSWYTRVA